MVTCWVCVAVCVRATGDPVGARVDGGGGQQRQPDVRGAGRAAPRGHVVRTQQDAALLLRTHHQPGKEGVGEGVWGGEGVGW